MDLPDSATSATATPPSRPGPDDPPPFRLVNEAGRAPVLLLGDHAGRAIPSRLDGLGVGPAVLDRHIAYDIGVETMIEAMAAALDAPAIVAGFSRLVIDPNRQLRDPTLICAISDGVVIPRNRAVDAAERAWRIDRLYAPYHAAVAARLDRFAASGVAPAVLSVHSFTPALRTGGTRPWQVGILWADDPRLPVPLMAALREEGLVVGDNQPYDGRNAHGCTMETHVYPRGLPNALIEVRNDLIAGRDDAAAWGRRLARVAAPVLARMACGGASG